MRSAGCNCWQQAARNAFAIQRVEAGSALTVHTGAWMPEGQAQETYLLPVHRLKNCEDDHRYKPQQNHTRDYGLPHLGFSSAHGLKSQHNLSLASSLLNPAKDVALLLRLGEGHTLRRGSLKWAVQEAVHTSYAPVHTVRQL